MKRISAMIFFCLLNCFAFADALQNMEVQCSDLLKTYGQTLSQIADERAKLNEKILKAEEETKSLEAKLKSIRENSVNYDLALKNLAAKTSMYDGLRSAVQELAASLNSQKIMPARDFDGVLSQISELLEKADAEIFSAKILDYAIVGQNGEDFLKSLESGGRFSAKLDTSLGKIPLVKTRTFKQKIEAGGVWIYPILAFGAMAFLVSIFKAFTSLSMGRISPECVAKISSLLEKGDEAGAVKLAENAPKPHSAMLKKFLENRGISKSLTEEIAYEQMLSCGEKLFSGLGVVAVSAAISPLLGLLGTVTGIIKTFGDLSVYGAGNPQLMSGGISEALITTEFGLMVAIPSFVLHAVLSRRGKAILSDMEKAASEYISKNCK